MKMRIFIFLFIFLLLSFTSSNAIGVSPARIDFGVLSRENPVEMEFSIFNTQDKETNYLVHTASYEGWFEFIPEEVSIPSGQSAKIRAIANIPNDISSGEYNTIFYIKQIPAHNDRISMIPAVAIKATLFVADKDWSADNVSLPLKEMEFSPTKEIQNRTNQNEKPENSSLFKINSNAVKQTNQQKNFAEIDKKGLIITASILFIGILLHSFKKTGQFDF